MTTIINGLVGGLVVAAVAAIATWFVADGPSAPSVVLQSMVGGTISTSRRWLFVFQLCYGSIAGGTLVVLELFVLGVLAVPPTALEALVVAVAWGSLLAVLLLATWRSVLGLRFDKSSRVKSSPTISSTLSASASGYGRPGSREHRILQARYASRSHGLPDICPPRFTKASRRKRSHGNHRLSNREIGTPL